MVDVIRSLRKDYGLTADQIGLLEASYRKLPQDKRDAFGKADFDTLMANDGIRDFGAAGGGAPELVPAKASGWGSLTIDSFAATATPGSAIMALLTKNAAEQRQINKEVKAAEAESIAQTIEKQADEMREKALIQLILGVVSGAVTIAGGAFTAYKSGVALGQGLDAGQAALTNAKISGYGQAFQGSSSILGTVSQYIGTKYDAKIKEMDASIERSRSNVESLKDFNEARNELIRKSLSTAEAMQESANQARSKILA